MTAEKLFVEYVSSIHQSHLFCPDCGHPLYYHAICNGMVSTRNIDKKKAAGTMYCPDCGSCIPCQYCGELLPLDDGWFTHCHECEWLNCHTCGGEVEEVSRDDSAPDGAVFVIHQCKECGEGG